MNKYIYIILFFIRMIAYCYIFLTFFQIVFPYTGLGAGLYAAYFLGIWVLVGFTFTLLLLIKPIYNLRLYIEIIYLVSLFSFLLFTFGQTGDPPICQLMRGKFPTIKQIKDGIRLFFGK